MYHILLSLIAIGAPLDCKHASELIDSVRNNPDKSEQDISQWEALCSEISVASSANSIIWMNDVFILTHSDYIGKKYCDFCYNLRKYLLLTSFQTILSLNNCFSFRNYRNILTRVNFPVLWTNKSC